MSLEVKLNEITKLRGKADRFCTLTFRGVPLNSVVLTSIAKEAHFAEDFLWPLETLLDKDEYFEVKLFSRNKVSFPTMEELLEQIKSLVSDNSF